MNVASLNEIKKELQSLDRETLVDLCLRLARFKKDNKEMLNYLLFEAQHEHAYVQHVKEEMEEQFQKLPIGSNVYFIKKNLRKILRFASRQVKFSGIKESELEVRIFFCLKMKEAGIPMPVGTVLFNIYQQQIKKVQSLLEKLPEDLRSDFDREVKVIFD
jgi:hypothetical protein